MDGLQRSSQNCIRLGLDKVICSRFELSERIQRRLWLCQHLILLKLTTPVNWCADSHRWEPSVIYCLSQTGARSDPKIIKIKRNSGNRLKSKGLSSHSVLTAARRKGLYENISFQDFYRLGYAYALVQGIAVELPNPYSLSNLEVPFVLEVRGTAQLQPIPLDCMYFVAHAHHVQSTSWIVSTHIHVLNYQIVEGGQPQFLISDVLRVYRKLASFLNSSTDLNCFACLTARCASSACTVQHWQGSRLPTKLWRQFHRWFSREIPYRTPNLSG